MSGRRSRQSSEGGTSRISDDQIIQLVSKLQQLLPEIRNRRSNKNTALGPTIYYIHRTNLEYTQYLTLLKKVVPPIKASASKVLQETCNYIRNLHEEVDDLSDRLSQLLSTIDGDSPEAAIIRSLIM